MLTLTETRYHGKGNLGGLLFWRRAGPERVLDHKDGCRAPDHGIGVLVAVGWGSWVGGWPQAAYWSWAQRIKYSWSPAPVSQGKASDHRLQVDSHRDSPMSSGLVALWKAILWHGDYLDQSICRSPEQNLAICTVLSGLTLIVVKILRGLLNLYESVRDWMWCGREHSHTLSTQTVGESEQWWKLSTPSLASPTLPLRSLSTGLKRRETGEKYECGI